MFNRKLFLPFMIFVVNANPSIAIPYRQEIAQLYNRCEKQRDILDRAICMHILRGYIEEEYVYFIEDWTDLKSREFSQYSENTLKKMYQQERKKVQLHIPRLPRK